MQTVSVFNPLTYGVDALRIIILGDAWQSLYPLYHDVLIIVCFDLVMMAIGTLAFSRQK
jgi:ABC-type polysaccharide/polyol phosphate export permease